MFLLLVDLALMCMMLCKTVVVLCMVLLLLHIHASPERQGLWEWPATKDPTDAVKGGFGRNDGHCRYV